MEYKTDKNRMKAEEGDVELVLLGNQLFFLRQSEKSNLLVLP